MCPRCALILCLLGLSQASQFPPSKPCFAIELQFGRLAAWPEAESGMSNAVLSSFVGAIADDRPMATLWADLRDRNALVGFDFYDERGDEEALEALDAVCRFGAEVGDIDWTAAYVGRSPLSREWLRAHAVSPLDLARVVAAPPGTIRDVFEGRQHVDEAIVVELAARFDSTPLEAVEPIRGRHVREIDRPHRKGDVVAIATRRDVDEATARVMIWEQALAAARADETDPGIQAAKVDDAIRALLDRN